MPALSIFEKKEQVFFCKAEARYLRYQDD
jgi:hypothetical protein